MGSNPNPTQIKTDQYIVPPKVKMLINGQFVDSRTSQWEEVPNPATQKVLAKVPFSTSDEIDTAVAAAREAFTTWKNTPISTRARLFFRFQGCPFSALPDREDRSWVT